MEAIAMKMTQKEFDSIKGLLVDLEFNSVNYFDKYPYLVNCDEDNSISNVDLSFKHIAIKNPKVYEYFDRDIFLKACDIEVEKVWHSSELQYWNGNKWLDCATDAIYRLKPQPDYSKEIESLQDKAKENGMKAIITFENI